MLAFFMTGSRVVYFEGVGFVLFERSKRARNLSISVQPYGGIRVTVPVRESFKKAEEFASSKVGWMRKHLAGVRRWEAEYECLAMSSTKVSKSEARAKLAGRLKELAAGHGFSHNRTYIRNQKTLWGSCSANNNISLNMKLAKLPKELMDYVILHELVHTRIKTHGKRYWSELNKYVSNAKALDKKLKKYQPALTCK